MFALAEHFHTEPLCRCSLGECGEIEIEPGKPSALHRLILHTVLPFSIVMVGGQEGTVALLIVEDIADIGGVGKHLSAGRK